MKKKLKIPSLKNNFRFLKLVWKIDPARIIAIFIVNILGYFAWTLNSLVFMRYLFGDAGMERTFSDAAVFIWLFVLFNLVHMVISYWYFFRYSELSNIKLHYKLNKMLFEKASSCDMSCWDNPEFYDDYTRATKEAVERADAVADAIANLISASLSTAYVLYTMLTISWLTLPFMLFPLLGQFVFDRKAVKVNYEREQEEVPARRRYDYVNRTVYLKKYAEDMRLTGAYDVMSDTYSEAYGNIRAIIKRFTLRRVIWGFFSNLFSFPLPFQGIWLLGAVLVMVTKQIALGDFVVLSSAIVSSTWMMNSLAGAFNSMYENGLFVENFKRFMNWKPKIDESADGIMPVLPVETIEFCNVSFSYDGKEEGEYALKNVSLSFENGKKYSLVGLNGSGKTTLVKLLMRLYDPSEGVIKLNGVDIRKYKVSEYRRLIGTTFQDFSIFSATVLENVNMGEIKSEEERRRCLDALREAGVLDKINTLSERENTVLTREFDDDGAVLSGGENQKIAIARAFAKNAPIIILDEPSSALDPVAEHNMYEAINRLCETRSADGGRISVIISHRLSSALLSDYIYVMKDGEICERGSHHSLMELDGIYADMFRRQAENYVSAEEEGGNEQK